MTRGSHSAHPQKNCWHKPSRFKMLHSSMTTPQILPCRFFYPTTHKVVYNLSFLRGLLWLSLQAWPGHSTFLGSQGSFLKGEEAKRRKIKAVQKSNEGTASQPPPSAFQNLSHYLHTKKRLTFPNPPSFKGGLRSCSF